MNEIQRAEFTLKKNVIQGYLYYSKKRYAERKQNYHSELTNFMDKHRIEINLKRVE